MIQNSIKKIISLLLIIGLNWTGILAIGQTLASFNDTETSAGNVLAAGILDFRLTNQSADGFVGMENDGEVFHTSVAIPESGSMSMQYFVYSTSTSQACSEFRVRVKQNEEEIFDGFLTDFTSATTTNFGTWKFEFDLPVGASVTQGDLCQAKITFSAWREEVQRFEESGFSDIEEISLNLRAKTIVLNEVLANPDPNAPYPANREFIELKNNGNSQIDVAGWKISEMTSGGEERKYTITTTGGSYTAVPYGGSTVIPAGGWLVLLLSNSTALNNDGDTIRLYDSSDNKLDEYSYSTAKYGLSDARYPDGIGAWVDPIPTPGAPNVVEFELGEITESAISQVKDLTEESILNQENSSPQVEIEMENITEEENTTEKENMVSSEPEWLEEQDVFDEENEESFGESEEVETDNGKDIEQLQEATEEAVEEVIQEDFEISQEDEELDNSEEMDIDERDINEEDSISDENVFEEENTAGDGEEIEENAKDENAVDEIVEEDTEEIDAEIDSASEQEEIDEEIENDTEEDVTDGEENEIAAEKDGGEIEEGFISDQFTEGVSLDKNLTEGSGEVADEDSSSNSSDTQKVEEQTGSLPNSVSISGPSDDSDEGDSNDGDNSDSGGIDGGSES